VVPTTRHRHRSGKPRAAGHPERRSIPPLTSPPRAEATARYRTRSTAWRSLDVAEVSAHGRGAGALYERSKAGRNLINIIDSSSSSGSIDKVVVVERLEKKFT